MRKVLLGVFLAVFTLTPAFAAHESGGSSSMAGNELLFGTNAGAFSIDGPNMLLSSAVGYFRGFGQMQVGLTGGLGVGVATGNYWNLMAWGTYNLDEKLVDSFFASLGAGTGATAGSYLSLMMTALVGKRFELCHNLTYRPTVSLSHTFATAANWVVSFNFLQFSYLW